LTFEQASRSAQGSETVLLAGIHRRLDDIICYRRLGIPMLSRVAQRRIDAINRGIAADQLRLDIPRRDREFCEVPESRLRCAADPDGDEAHDGARSAVHILERKNGAGVFHGAFKTARSI